MTLGQRIVAKIKQVDTVEAESPEAREAYIASVIDEAISEVSKQYAGVLRDKFAGDALQGLLANTEIQKKARTERPESNIHDFNAIAAFEAADAMMKAREL